MTATYFILRSISAPDSNIKRESVEVTEFDAHHHMPVACHRVYSSNWQKSCSCDGKDGAGEKQRNCVHVALYRTWARQGRPQPRLVPIHLEAMVLENAKPLTDMGFEAIRHYAVDFAGVISYLKDGEWRKLSTVDQVNRVQ